MCTDEAGNLGERLGGGIGVNDKFVMCIRHTQPTHRTQLNVLRGGGEW